MPRRHRLSFRSVEDAAIIEVLLKAHDVYTDGDKVSGEVVLHHQHEHQFNDIQVHFCGKTGDDMDFGSGNDAEHYSTHFRPAAVLFHQQIDLHRGPAVIKGLRKWSFAFEFPARAEPVSSANGFRNDPCFENSPGHRLPPTVARGSRYGVLKHRRVRYYVEVLAQDLHGHKKRRFKHRVKLRYSPSRPLLHPSPNLSLRTFQFARTSRRLSQCRRAPHHFRKGKAFFVFRVQTAVPQQMYQGGPFPLSFGLEHDLAHSSTVEPPHMHLHAYRVQLVAVTDHRDDFTQELCRKRVVVAKARGKGSEMDLGALFHRELTPTFRTYDLARHYLLAVDFTVKCAGKKYKVRPDMVELVVLSALYRPLDTEPQPQLPTDTAYLRPSPSSAFFGGSSQSLRDQNSTEDMASLDDDASMQVLRPTKTAD